MIWYVSFEARSLIYDTFEALCCTYHLFHQILHDEALLLCANIGHPHPAIIQFIVNNKHVPFQEAEDIIESKWPLRQTDNMMTDCRKKGKIKSSETHCKSIGCYTITSIHLKALLSV